MNQTSRTWSVLLLSIAILLLVFWLLNRNVKPPQTLTKIGVRIPGTTNPDQQFPTRDDMNQVLLRICTYDNGHELSLDPGAVGGHCPPVFTSIDGSTGYLLKDEVIVVPQAGANTVPNPQLVLNTN